MKNIEIKIITKGQDPYADNDAIPTESRALDALIENIESGTRSTIYIHCQVSYDRLTQMIHSHYGDNVEIREGVSDGCYGARTGKSFKGLTVYVDASLFPVRFLDSEGDEIVNIQGLLDESGAELVEDLDGDVFEDACEDLGLKVSRNNTYNYSGHSAEDPCFLFDADYAVIQNDEGGKVYLTIKFHCGGDVRGNYTSKVVYKFDSIDDVYSVIYPMCQLKEQE